MILGIKALHIISVISWMAGMLYLPRLFVYHADVERGSASSEMLKVMERRLLKFIMTPALCLVWISGLWMGYAGEFWHEGWFLLKFALVIAMSGIHGFLSSERRTLEADKSQRSQKFFRILNEVPTLLMIGIVLLVIVKPF